MKGHIDCALTIVQTSISPDVRVDMLWAFGLFRKVYDTSLTYSFIISRHITDEILVLQFETVNLDVKIEFSHFVNVNLDVKNAFLHFENVILCVTHVF